MELTNTKQWKDKSVVDYINRCRSLSLNCNDRLFEVLVVEMCIQGMHLGSSVYSPRDTTSHL